MSRRRRCAIANSKVCLQIILKEQNISYVHVDLIQLSGLCEMLLHLPSLQWLVTCL